MTKLDFQFLIKYPTSLAMGLILISFLSGGCTSGQKKSELKAIDGPRIETFKRPFEDVWRAVQLSLAYYPIRVNNIDAGILETDYIKGENAFRVPGIRKFQSGGQRYKILVRVLKGQFKSNSAVQVTLMKRAELKRDFFSEYEKLSSNGLEELALMYRIRRELIIDRALKRYQEQKNKKEQQDKKESG